MAAVHGKNTVFKLDNAAGALQDLSAYLDTAALQRAIDSAETTTFGVNDKTYLIGLRGATIPTGGPWDATLDAHMEGVISGGQAATRSFEYGPEGSASGKVKYLGECFITAYEQSSPVGDKATWSGTLQVSGAVTRTTWP